MSVLKYKDEDGAFHKVPLYGAATWSELQNKPFTELDAETLAVTDGKLAVIGGGSEVSISQALTEGTEIGTITIDGTDTKLYAPIPGDNFTVTVVETLPESGENEKFYLVPASNTEENNSYDEYVWVEDTNKFELVGSTSIDLSDYAKIEDIKEVSATQTLTEGTEIGSIAINGIETKLYAPIHDDNFEIEIVTELPSTGENNKFYLIPSTNTKDENLYNEYIWLESLNKFELVGTSSISSQEVENMYLNIDTYTEDEQVIGSWINGKPIYRKAIKYISAIKTGSVTTDISLEAEKIINLGIYEATHGYYQPLIGYLNSGFLVYNARDNLDANDNNYFVVEYTKTTDEENSFSADSITSKINVKGIGYENYSEDEIVIGKWIDGRPVYRKCITKSVSNETVILNLDEVDNLIYIIGIPSDIHTEQHMIIGGQLNSTWYTGFHIVNNTLKVFGSTNTLNTDYNFILEYTKTTDAENSFTPSMVASGITETKGETTYTDDEVSSAISTILGGEE